MGQIFESAILIKVNRTLCCCTLSVILPTSKKGTQVGTKGNQAYVNSHELSVQSHATAVSVDAWLSSDWGQAQLLWNIRCLQLGNPALKCVRKLWVQNCSSEMWAALGWWQIQLWIKPVKTSYLRRNFIYLAFCNISTENIQGTLVLDNSYQLEEHWNA